MLLRPLMFIFAMLGAVSAARAHEVWIDAGEFQAKTGATITAHLRNGQNFKGFSLAYFENRIHELKWTNSGTWREISGRAGNIPAIRIENAPEGLLRIAYQSRIDTVRYKTWALFENFVTHKDLGDALARHVARGLPEAGFGEGYARYVKALIGVGDAAGADARVGLEIEIVALANPYTDDLGDGMPVRLFYRDAPRGDAQLEIFARAPDGTVEVTTTRTDAQGMARIPVRPGHVYLFDAVVLREPDADLAQDKDVVWESLWAALTFAVPD